MYNIVALRWSKQKEASIVASEVSGGDYVCMLSCLEAETSWK